MQISDSNARGKVAIITESDGQNGNIMHSAKEQLILMIYWCLTPTLAVFQLYCSA